MSPPNIPTRILGIDYGLSRLGFSLSDERKMIASPLSTLQAEKKSEHTVQKLLEFIKELQHTYHCTIEQIVIGMPLLMSGRTGFLADEVAHFITLFKQSSSISIQAWDERLTTVQAERSLRESSLTRKRRSKIVDKVSAAIILQSYLDHLNLKTR
jgi:putative Holliday junction resolvase